MVILRAFFFDGLDNLFLLEDTYFIIFYTLLWNRVTFVVRRDQV